MSSRADGPLALLWGDADELKRRALAQIVDARLEPDEREFGLIRIHADETGLDGIVSELRSGSLMAPERVVVVDNITALLNLQQRALAERLTQLQPGLTVVLIEAKQVERRGWGPSVAAALRKVVEAHGQIIACSPPRERALPGWVQEECAALGKRMDRDAAELLCEMVGADVDLLLRELEKLTTYVGAREQVSAEDVRTVSTRLSQADIFAIVDAIGLKDAATALSLLEGVLPEGTSSGEYFRFLGMIQRQLRLIWQARYLRQQGVRPGEKPPAEVAARLPEHHNFLEATSGDKTWLAEKFTRQAALFSDGQLARALDRVYQADLAIKGKGPKLNERAVIELLIAELCR